MLSTNIFGQLGVEVLPNIPDTVQIQYLAKADTIVNQKLAMKIVNMLSDVENDDTNEFQKYQLKFYKTDKVVRYTIVCWGSNRLDFLSKIRELYSDAYYIDNRGWKIHY